MVISVLLNKTKGQKHVSKGTKRITTLHTQLLLIVNT